MPLLPVRALTLPLALGGLVLAAGCSSTQGAASADPGDLAFAEPSEQLARQIQVKAVEAEFYRSGEDFVRIADWFYNVGEPAYETLLDMAAGTSTKAKEVALAVFAVRADHRVLARFQAEVPEPEEQNLRMDYGRALLFMGDMTGAGYLIDGLEDPVARKRAMAYRELQKATNNAIPFDPFGTDEERAEGLTAWRRWYAALTADPMLED